MRVLVVEDNPRVAEVLKRLIEMPALHSVTAIVGSCSAALQSIEAQAPDLVMLDLSLEPGSTGYALAAELRQTNIPCLFATASPPPFPVPELALGCLCKPYTTTTVAIALRLAESIILGVETPNDPILELDVYRYDLPLRDSG